MATEMHPFSREALREFASVLAAINSSLESERVLDAIAQAAARLMNAEAGSVLTLNKRRDKFVFAAASGPVGRN